MKKKNELQKGVDFIGVTVVFYCHDGKGNFLMHKRSKNCRDEVGNWDVGGGGMEFGETFEEAVEREIMEEYSCSVENLKFITSYNVLRKNGKQDTHWIALLFTAKVNPEKVAIGEPDYIDEIGWFSENNLPDPLHSQFFTCFDMVKKHL
ncbi:hypothetical protein A3B39_00175 [Candidatus Daviesbacteria bacterium RIFCSPLOWO2_01_FULL_37_10]|nr:MAG: hypothetical protein A3B39_00175 [Candidatus Daviesbacteria bacterium RIFCSPLOWO2_01_FULL_37_10]